MPTQPLTKRQRYLARTLNQYGEQTLDSLALHAVCARLYDGSRTDVRIAVADDVRVLSDRGLATITTRKGDAGFRIQPVID